MKMRARGERKALLSAATNRDNLPPSFGSIRGFRVTSMKETPHKSVFSLWSSVFTGMSLPKIDLLRSLKRMNESPPITIY